MKSNEDFLNRWMPVVPQFMASDFVFDFGVAIDAYASTRVAEAVAAEREACASFVETHGIVNDCRINTVMPWDAAWGINYTGKTFAAAIRARTATPPARDPEKLVEALTTISECFWEDNEPYEYRVMDMKGVARAALASWKASAQGEGRKA